MVNGYYSDFFENKVGLMQGEVLSPILFAMYVNDCEVDFISNCYSSTEMKELSLFLLMYADDMVIFSETVEGLQDMLNVLYNYTQKWNLSVNIDKTKIVIFRNGGNIKEKEKWYYNGTRIDVVNSFTYLGIILNYNGKFTVTQKHVADQGRKALFALFKHIKPYYFNHMTLLSLFDTYISSVLCYGSEIWGFHKAPDVEKVHIDFCKRILNVKVSTPNVMIYYELGRYPMLVARKIRMFKYWIKVMNSDNCILRKCYEYLFDMCLKNPNDRNNWVCCLRNELFNLGLNDMWYNQSLLCPEHVLLFKQKLYDMTKQDFDSKLNASPKCILYKYLVSNVCLQPYLCKPIPDLYKKSIVKLRLSSHNLAIEEGRYAHIERTSRYCKICFEEMEDEMHFILVCPLYLNLRKELINPYYWRKPSTYKLLQLFNSTNVKDLCNLGKYIFRALKLRNDCFY